MPDVGNHYRAGGDAPVPAGVYRVVGLAEGRVTLLRVADGDGNRTHTGAVEYVDADGLAALDPAEAPVKSRLGRLASGLVAGLRQAPRNVRARPIQGALGAGLLIVAAVGPAAVPVLPSTAIAVADVLGAVLLGAAAAGLPRSG